MRSGAQSVPRTKANLTYQLGQLVQAITHSGQDDLVRHKEFEFIEFVLNFDVRYYSLSVSNT
jgi:hypothetical protein